jgi:hypothetical protein
MEYIIDYYDNGCQCFSRAGIDPRLPRTKHKGVDSRFRGNDRKGGFPPVRSSSKAESIDLVWQPTREGQHTQNRCVQNGLGMFRYYYITKTILSRPVCLLHRSREGTRDMYRKRPYCRTRWSHPRSTGRSRDCSTGGLWRRKPTSTPDRHPGAIR